MFQDKVVVITGGAGGIGKCIREEFEKAGAKVCIIDIADNPYFVGDIGDEATLRRFAEKVIEEHGRVDCLINNAPPLFKGINECTYEEFNYALRVGVSSAFLLTQLFQPYFAPGASIINISSSRDRMSQPQSESYAAAKGGISALTHALAVSFGGKVRVNSISPGWSTQITRSTRGRTPFSSPPDGWATRWISPIWCCSCAQIRQDSSPARISASTAARRDS